MARYGLPYMGSKSKIADWVLSHIPQADVLVDMFAGGCAITHAALLSNKFKHIVANDITDAPQLFLKACNGEYVDNKEWISRQDFERLKNIDPFVAFVWSFGNNGRDYLYSRNIEAYKKTLHCMITADTVTERRQLFKQVIKELQKIQGYSERTIAGVENLERLANLERLGRLNELKDVCTASLTVTKADYRKLEIPSNAVVYCDPPYKGTQVYSKQQGFDHSAFWEWCRQIENPVVVSEYNAPDDFVCIAEKPILKTMSATNNKCRSVERLFTII